MGVSELPNINGLNYIIALSAKRNTSIQHVLRKPSLSKSACSTSMLISSFQLYRDPYLQPSDNIPAASNFSKLFSLLSNLLICAISFGSASISCRCRLHHVRGTRSAFDVSVVEEPSKECDERYQVGYASQDVHSFTTCINAANP